MLFERTIFQTCFNEPEAEITYLGKLISSLKGAHNHSNGMWNNHMCLVGIACWLACQTRDRKVANSNLPFSSPEWTLCADSYSVSVPPPVLPQWLVKNPDHSAKSAGGRLHLNIHTSLTELSQSGLIVLLSRHSVGTCPEMSSHATCQETFDHNYLSLLSHCGLILA